MPLQVEYFPSYLAGLYFSWGLVIYWILSPDRAPVRSGLLMSERFRVMAAKFSLVILLALGTCSTCALRTCEKSMEKQRSGIRVTHSLELRLAEQSRLENTSEIIISVICRLLERQCECTQQIPAVGGGNAIAQIKTSEYFCLLPGLRQPHFRNYCWLRAGVT